jgi:phosphoadenosine phosphosulfate reductase
MSITRQAAEELAAEAADLSAQNLLALVEARFPGRVALASSFSLEDQVLTDMLQIVAPTVAVFTLDTGRLPQETHDVIDATRKRYGVEIEMLSPDAAEVEGLVRQYGPNLFYASVERRQLCCQVRKVHPLRRRLATLDAWITGLRRGQAATRGDVGRVEWDPANGLVKINPLADWTEDQVWHYVRESSVPYNRLHNHGYPSIGCAPCTRAVAPGEDIRAGRWWWEEPEHKECGLHVGKPHTAGGEEK